MKRILCATAVLVLLTASTWAQGVPNFSGTWKLDVAKSDFGPAPPPESIVMVIDHQEPAIKATTTQKSQMGDTSNTSMTTTDGKVNVNKMSAMGAEQDVKSTSKWNGRKLMTSRTIEVQGMAIDIADTWDLSADGKVITIDRVIKTPQGDFTTKTVMVKQ